MLNLEKLKEKIKYQGKEEIPYIEIMKIIDEETLDEEVIYDSYFDSQNQNCIEIQNRRDIGIRLYKNVDVTIFNYAKYKSFPFKRLYEYLITRNLIEDGLDSIKMDKMTLYTIDFHIYTDVGYRPIQYSLGTYLTEEDTIKRRDYILSGQEDTEKLYGFSYECIKDSNLYIDNFEAEIINGNRILICHNDTVDKKQFVQVNEDGSIEGNDLYEVITY